MFLNSFRFSWGLPVLWLCVAVLNACGAVAMEYPYTVYRGTFIHLPRLNSSSAKPELARNQGALWVSSEDGRIKGYDWNVVDDASFQTFMSSHGWTAAAASTKGNSNSHTRAEAVEVQVVESNDERNEFFFPGFIGMPYLSG